jgi:hypothetical protein
MQYEWHSVKHFPNPPQQVSNLSRPYLALYLLQSFYIYFFVLFSFFVGVNRAVGEVFVQNGLTKLV